MLQPTKAYKISLFLQTACYLMTPRWIETVLLKRSKIYTKHTKTLALKLAVEDCRLEAINHYSNHGAE